PCRPRAPRCCPTWTAGIARRTELRDRLRVPHDRVRRQRHDAERNGSLHRGRRECFKMFMAYPGVFYATDGEILRAMQQAAQTGALVMMHTENGIAIDHLVAQAAGRPADAVTICVAAPAYVGTDLAHQRNQLRWFGGMVGNHVADLVRRYGTDGPVPTALTDYIAGRQGYDYSHHGRAGNPDTEFVPDDIALADRAVVRACRPAARAGGPRRRPVRGLPHARPARGHHGRLRRRHHPGAELTELTGGAPRRGRAHYRGRLSVPNPRGGVYSWVWVSGYD